MERKTGLIDTLQTIFYYASGLFCIAIAITSVFNLLVVFVAVIGSMFETGKFWKPIVILSMIFLLFYGLSIYEKNHPGKPWVRPHYDGTEEYEDTRKCYGGNVCE